METFDPDHAARLAARKAAARERYRSLTQGTVGSVATSDVEAVLAEIDAAVLAESEYWSRVPSSRVAA